MRLTAPFLSGIALAAILATAPQAQVSPNRGPTQQVPATTSLELNMQDQHVLKEVLLKDKDTKVKPEPTAVELEPGKEVPDAVRLHPFPEFIATKIPKVKAHEFFVAGNAVVIVEPQKRIIAQVVK